MMWGVVLAGVLVVLRMWKVRRVASLHGKAVAKAMGAESGGYLAERRGAMLPKKWGIGKNPRL